MAEETKTTLDGLKDAIAEAQAAPVADAAPAVAPTGAPVSDAPASDTPASDTPEIDAEILPEPKKDARGRSYATGKRKNAIARVWIKPGADRKSVV